MTTIAFDGEVIAYDSRVTAGDSVITDDLDKRYEIEGVSFFSSGEVGTAKQIAQTYFGEECECPNFESLVVDSGRVYKFGKYKSGVQKYEIDFPHAVGSGESHAITAMDLGCTAREAVKMAMKRDAGTGGKIRTFKIKR